ncbi:efflux RND transporter periplasmic adaptor subunit [Chrysiogenes arsenatis]|uniref:efflux RND transporter periplasmic adaptor subunit n=1 Tax=Chrysiogenes arsenatis TaxID=309797 RepID=UPI000420A68A|nr:efflux RND transporter periplasmic adaptor subunit [Chrysiogenes arsenatis]
MASKEAFRQRLQELYHVRVTQSQAGQASWIDYLVLVKNVCRVPSAELILVQEHQLLLVATSDLEQKSPSKPLLDTQEFFLFLQRAEASGFAHRPPHPHIDGSIGFVALRALCPTPYFLILAIDCDAATRLNDILVRAQLMLDFVQDESVLNTSALLGTESKAVDARKTAHENMLASLLDLLSEIYQSENFQAAVYALANGIVNYQSAFDQVVLGWKEGAYTRVKGISHYERFEQKTDTVRLFEAALEESVDQVAAIHYSSHRASDGKVITLAHQQLQTHLAARSIMTFPLVNSHGHTVFALTLVNYRDDLPELPCEAVHFLARTVMPRLEQLYLQDAEWRDRLRTVALRTIGRLAGAENLLVKSLVLAGSLLLFGSLTFSTMHTVEGTGQFVTDNTRLITAPFEGVIIDAYVTSGDEVVEGDPLLTLDVQDLLMQLAELQAELQRNVTEADRARAEFTSVDLAIALARIEQVKARMERVNYQLSQAHMHAPFTGVVVEGERRELISAPVSKGQPLLRIAQTEDVYVVVEVAHDDIHHVREGSIGEFALVSQPGRKIPLRISRVIPMAEVKSQEGARFTVIAQLEEDGETWWRPGMTGVAKIHVQPRSYFWIYTHKTLNRIRLALWR